MRTAFHFLFICCFVMGCAARPPLNTLTQTSTIDVLLAGVYDGDMTCGELLDRGDFGIGTFDRLDGEMIVLDGRVYQVRADGRVYQPPAGLKTPFAAVARFQADTALPLVEPLDDDALQRVLDAHMADPHLFYAIRVTGRFARMHTRSVPAQEKPYPPLAQVTARQPEFEMEDVTGTIVGFRCPAYVKGINVPGYHLHFLSDDRRQGGHILDFELVAGRAEIDRLSTFTLVMPENAERRHLLDLSRDRSDDLEQVEK